MHLNFRLPSQQPNSPIAQQPYISPFNFLCTTSIFEFTRSFR